MKRATPKLRDLATRLLAEVARGARSADSKTPPVFQVCAILRPRLSSLMGSTGFSALLSRALALAHPEVPWLRAVHVQPDGSLNGLVDLGKQVDPEEQTEGSVVLLAQLLGLLVAFIGANLTLQLILELWPKLSLRDFDLNGDTK